jgi:ADP-heptose:LPS heptosyltransferase
MVSVRNTLLGRVLCHLFVRAGRAGAPASGWERRMFAALARQLDIVRVCRRWAITPPFIAVQPSVLNHAPTPRRWPMAQFVALIDQLHREGHRVVLLGDRNEAAYAVALAARCASPPRNLVGETAFTDAVSLIRASDALVCHDGGLLFIANALAHPTVVLVGPSACVESAPLSATTHVVRAGLLCAPCIGLRDDGAALRACPFDVACMRQISTVDALTALRRAAGKVAP